ncbi:trypsin-like serine protease [Vulgatibacter incomptus]|uniref:Peptidase S1 domain-containing protein n=1 Tax=Vulgatibacter incomptus TaxID=1391653 RepID=A0A0K1PE01_9BACT|nr:trypsin-like serine protease [Vulgatibacter incomptus]AKU91763.1 hypothetical protein AKJ08_2150 [Vulgatibacter incomptus]
MLAACQAGEVTPVDEVVDQSAQPIYGTFQPDYPTISKAEELSTWKGVAGAVAFVRRPDTNRECSGTLVSRRHVVTAGHCVVGDSVGSIRVSFAQDRNYPEFKEIDRETFGRTPRNRVSGRDIVLLTLDRDVPMSLVKKIPAYNAGSVKEFMSRNRRGGFIQVGYGLSRDYQGNVVWDQKRRYGPVNWVTAERRKCNRFKVAGSTCLDFPEIWAPYGTGQAMMDSGDSGGALFGMDIQTGEYVLLGVTSGDRGWWDGSSHQAWAHLGTIDGIGTDLTPFIPDADGDGVPDQFDNCPPSLCVARGWPLSRCFNPDQLDEDNDGVGDACDNCPPSRCAALGDGRSCANSRQIDSDGDGVGDVCDSCPMKDAPQTISNGGTVGDACNGCPGMALHFLPCLSGSTTCESARAGICLFDYDKDGRPLPGRCSQLADWDGDGVPDACDYCPYDWDPENRNANLHIENDVNVSRLGDVCDPVPVYDFAQGEPPVYREFAPPFGLGAEGVDYQTIEGHSWLGFDGTRFVTSISQPTVFQHCSCISGGRYQTEASCADRIECRPRWADRVLNGWKPLTVAVEPNAAPFPPTGRSLRFDTNVSHPYSFVWNSFDDIMRSNNPVDRDPANPLRTHGLVASIVTRVNGVFASTRDAGSWNLRTVVRMFDTPNYEIYKRDWRFGPCSFPNCLGWEHPLARVWNPPEDRILDRIRPFVFDAGWVGLVRRDGAAVDAFDGVSPRLTELMSSGKWRWVPAAEEPAVLARFDAYVGVLVPREGTGAGLPLPLTLKDGQIDIDGDPEYDSGMGFIGAVQISDEERGAFSGLQGILYLVGRDSDPGLRRYDLSTGVAGFATFEYEPDDENLGIALDTVRNRLYLLQVEDAGKTVSLVSYDLANGRRDNLLTVPRQPGLYEKTALAVDSTGALTIFASARGRGLEAWRYMPSGADAKFGGKFTDEGVLYDEPRRSDLVPVWMEREERNQMRLLSLSAQSFSQYTPCTGL